MFTSIQRSAHTATTQVVTGGPDLGWTVAATANGRTMITDEHVAAVEVTDSLAVDVRHYLTTNGLIGPVLAAPGARRREIHLVVGIAKADRAIAALRAAGAVVHTDGAALALPPTRFTTGAVRWVVAPDTVHRMPPLVALAAAVRATAGARGSATACTATCA